MSKLVYKNFFFLFLVQFSNYVLPFLVIPLLTRTLGVEGFGKYAFYLGIANLLLVFIRFGFEFSATRTISIHSDDKAKITEVVSSVLLIKLGLLFLTIAAFVLGIVFIKPDEQIALILLGGCLLLVGQMLLPVWYFQGMQQMKFVTLYTVVTKIIYVSLLFILIRELDDYGLAVFVYGFSFFIAGLVSAAHMFKQVGFSISSGLNNLKLTFVEALPFFTSRAFVMAYTSSMIPLIGFIGTSTQVAIYSASEKLFNALQSLMYPLANALYPHIAKNKDINLFKKLFALAMVCLVIVCVAGYFIAPYLITFLFGEAFALTTHIFNIHLIALMFVFPSIMLGYPLLAALGFSKAANGSVVIGACTFFLIAGLGIYLDYSNTEYFVWAVVAAELVVFILRAYFAINKLWLKKLHIVQKP